jgi:hypothetical protein
MDEFRTVIERIRKPLAFAARDNFAHIKSLTDLEPFIKTQIVELRRLAKEGHKIAEIEKLFSGFDSLPPDRKKERIIKAEAVIDALEHGIGAPADGLITPSHLPAPSSPVVEPAVSLRLDTPIQYCRHRLKRGDAQKLGIPPRTRSYFPAL